MERQSKFSNRRSVKDLINIATQLLQSLFNKGFRLTKWISNSQITLDQLPTAELEIKNKIKDLTYEKSIKMYLDFYETLNQTP